MNKTRGHYKRVRDLHEIKQKKNVGNSYEDICKDMLS